VPGAAGPRTAPGGATKDGPHWSQRARNVPQKPGNIYSEGTMVDKDLQKQPWKGNLVSIIELPKDVSSDTTQTFLEHIVNSTTEGGVTWISELLSKAISYHDNLPDPAHIQE
jgi:hypothetical protein